MSNHCSIAGGGKLEAFFTIDRVRTLLRQESGRTMKLAVTGHSLGAAVACMLSFQLHQECPGGVVALRVWWW